MTDTNTLVTLSAHPQATIHLHHDWAARADRPAATACDSDLRTTRPALRRLASYDNTPGTTALHQALDHLDAHPDRLCRRCFNPTKILNPYARRWHQRHHTPGATPMTATAAHACTKTITGTNGEHTYHLVRFYEDNGLLYRVTVTRDSYPTQSSAVCELLTNDLTWTHFMHNPASNWHTNTSPHPDRGTGVHKEPGNDTLTRIADTLFYESRAILTRHRRDTDD